MLAEGAQWGDDDIDIDAEINQDMEATDDTNMLGAQEDHD